jgi:cold shock CspA family protein
MQSSLVIAWEHMSASDALERRIEREVANLEKTFGRITACRVFVEGPGATRRNGRRYSVRIKLELPRRAELVASRNPDQASEHEDAFVAVRDAFQALRRQLREHIRRHRPQSPRHDDRQHGVVSALQRANGHGYITADDGRQIYFHKNALIGGDFETVQTGAEVRFVEQEGDEGPQASSVHVFGPGSRRRLRAGRTILETDET